MHKCLLDQLLLKKLNDNRICRRKKVIFIFVNYRKMVKFLMYPEVRLSAIVTWLNPVPPPFSAAREMESPSLAVFKKLLDEVQQDMV